MSIIFCNQRKPLGDPGYIIICTDGCQILKKKHPIGSESNLIHAKKNNESSQKALISNLLIYKMAQHSQDSDNMDRLFQSSCYTYTEHINN